MMTGAFYIDGIDAYAEFGVFVTDGGYRGVVQWPALKTPDTNDWPEEDGVDVDLTAPKLDTRTFGIEFAGVREYSASPLIEYLSDSAYHEFDFREIGIVRTLRLVASPNRQTVLTLKKFTLDFADDDPASLLTDTEPVRTDCWQTGFEIDGRPLSDYGVWVTDGSHDEIVKSPAVKQNLLINTPAIDGAQYDGAQVVFQSKEVSLKCHITADIATFWRNYTALLRDLVKPGERTFYYDKWAEEYACHYKSASVTVFSQIGGKVWCDFEVTLVFTSFRIEMDYVLATEDGHLIATEQDAHAIETRNY